MSTQVFVVMIVHRVRGVFGVSTSDVCPTTERIPQLCAHLVPLCRVRLALILFFSNTNVMGAKNFWLYTQVKPIGGGTGVKNKHAKGDRQQSRDSSVSSNGSTIMPNGAGVGYDRSLVDSMASTASAFSQGERRQRTTRSNSRSGLNRRTSSARRRARGGGSGSSRVDGDDDGSRSDRSSRSSR